MTAGLGLSVLQILDGCGTKFVKYWTSAGSLDVEEDEESADCVTFAARFSAIGDDSVVDAEDDDDDDDDDCGRQDAVCGNTVSEAMIQEARKSLQEGVRGYRGDMTVNGRIRQTLRSAPLLFV